MSVSAAKDYSRRKYILALSEIIYTLLILFFFSLSGLSRWFVEIVLTVSPQIYIAVPLYMLIILSGYYFLSLPLNFYRSHILDHKFLLSNQSLKGWFFEQLKAGAVAYVISLILIGAFYYILRSYPYNWWFMASLFWVSFSLVLAKLMPVLIIPLFFKYKKLSDEELRRRVFSLAKNMKIKILDVFEINFSKKTLKANAAFVGVGNTRRVLLADTLKDKYNYNEIEVILAHEFAHCRLKHLFKLIALNSLLSLGLFYIIFASSSRVLRLFGLVSLEDLAALPVVMLYLVLFGIIIQPAENYISRRFEKNADRIAIVSTGMKKDFISTMEKLAGQNLADRAPHPVIKFFFFDHPPIDERIALARAI